METLGFKRKPVVQKLIDRILESNGSFLKIKRIKGNKYGIRNRISGKIITDKLYTEAEAIEILKEFTWETKDLKKWIPPKIWENGTAYIIGGGPGVKAVDLSLIHDKHVIGVNNAYLLGDWVDVGWFGDKKWLLWHRNSWKKSPCIKASCNHDREVLKHDSGWIHFMSRGKAAGIETAPGSIAWNRCSGSSAINLAYHLGATRIVLIGFDMHDVDGKKNFHKDHKDNGNAPYKKFLGCYGDIAKDAVELGVEIINATPDSALRHFPYFTLEKIKGII